MNPKIIAQRVIDFNKATFDNTFDTITALQDHSEKMVNLFLENASLFPPDGKKVIAEWIAAYKQGQKDFKKSVDDSFKTVEDYFVDSANSMGFSICIPREKMDQSVGGVTDNLKKATNKIVDKSMPTRAIVADKYLKQNIIVKKKKVVAGKTGVGIVKAARTVVKPIKK